MPKAIKPIRPGEYLPADVIARLQNAIAEVIVGGRGINVSRQGNRIVIERTGNQIIPTSGRATNYGDDIMEIDAHSYEGDNDAVARDDHVHGMSLGAFRYVDGVRIWWFDDKTARDNSVDHDYEDMGVYMGYPFCGDLSYQLDNHHLYICRDTGSEFVWEGLSHWEAAST